jgi:hypothetical protein
VFDNPPQLLVSLPRNDAALAEAALAGGADALKVHLNVEHRASGTVFGSLADERPALEEILGLGAPVGVVIGGLGAFSRDEMSSAVAMGFAFVDCYLSHAPAWYIDAAYPAIAVVAVGVDDPLERVVGLSRLGIGAVEASLTPPDEYGTPLRLHRVADYARLAAMTELPVIVPSQHAIDPDDVPALLRAGVGAVLLGAVVTGSKAAPMQATVGAFRAAIDTAKAIETP